MFVDQLLPAARARLVTIADDARLTEVAALLGERHVNLVVVCNPAGSMVGVVTKSDVVRRISHCRGSTCTIAVASVMTRDVVACRPEDRVDSVWAAMKAHDFVHLPVVGPEAMPLGVVSPRDALDALRGEAEQERSLLIDYVMGVGYR